MSDNCCNTTTAPPPAPPIVHYYCGGIERAVCGERLTLDKKGPCFTTHYPKTTCEACRRRCPPPYPPETPATEGTTEEPGSRDLTRAVEDLRAAYSQLVLIGFPGGGKDTLIVAVRSNVRHALSLLTAPASPASAPGKRCPACYEGGGMHIGGTGYDCKDQGCASSSTDPATKEQS